MQESIVKESPRRRIGRRVAAAGMALAAALTLAGCDEARGGGYIGAPVDSSVISPVFNGRANFGFNFTCDAQGQGPDHVPRHQHKARGFSVPFRSRRSGSTAPWRTSWSMTDPMIPTRHLEPVTCRSRARTLSSPSGPSSRAATGPRTRRSVRAAGKFTVLVFDQGEPSARAGTSTGDGFSIDLEAGPTPLHPGRLHRGRQHPGGVTRS